MTKPDASVTVLIAAYNAEAFISRAIESALLQTLPAAEILIVDDASTDGTANFIESLAADNPKIRLLRLEKNGGPSAARNAGIDAAIGDWIAVLDADDAFYPDRLADMVQTGLNENADIVLDNFSYYDVASNSIWPPSLKVYDAIETIGVETYVEKARPYNAETDYGLLKPLFKKSFLNQHNLRYPVFSRHGEDFLFMVSALLESAKCVLTRKAGYIYTSRASGFSRTIINYGTMQEHSRQLMADRRVEGNSVLIANLQERIRRLQTLTYENNISRNPNPVSFMRYFMSDRMFRKLIFQKIKRKTKLTIKKALSLG